MKTLKQLNYDLPWSTRIFTLMALIVVVGAFLLNAWTTNFALTIALTLAVLLLLESFVISIQRHPRTWKMIRWTLLLLLLMLLLLGTILY